MSVVPRRARRAVVGLVVLALGATGCSSSESGGDQPEATGTEVVDAEGRPEIELPGGPPPEGLAVDDLIEGAGPAVADEAMLTLHYVGLTWSGAEVTSSWERGQPLIYRYGDGRWVEGWTAGLEGMRQGGRRRIVVPPGLGYGERSAPGVPAGETLIFVVDLVEVTP